jgi:hypothetical protein
MATKTTDTTKTKSAKDLLSGLTAGKKPTPKKAETSSRPEMELPAELEQTFKRFIGAHALCELVEARRDQEKAVLDVGCFDEWTERLWKSKARPANPSVKLDKDNKPDMSAIYQVQERYVMNFPAAEGADPAEVAIELFQNMFSALGMKDSEALDSATRLVQNELDFTPKTTIDFNRLVNGHYEGEGKNRTWVDASDAEQTLASKVIALLNCRSAKDAVDCDFLTDEEQAQLIEVKLNVTVKPHFLQRVCSYVNSLEQLRAIFTVIKPVKYPSHVKFAASDTPENKNRRLYSEAKDILGVTD